MHRFFKCVTNIFNKHTTTVLLCIGSHKRRTYELNYKLRVCTMLKLFNSMSVYVHTHTRKHICIHTSLI